MHLVEPAVHAAWMADRQHLDDQLKLVCSRLVDDFAGRVPEREVRSCLSRVVKDLGETKVTTYVPVLVERQVRQRLRALVDA